MTSKRSSSPASGDYQAEVRMGKSLYEKGRYEEARQAFERAILLKNNGTEAAVGLAKILLMEGAHADARDLYEAALTHGLEQSPEHFTNLGICYAFDGERAKARIMLEAAIAVDESYEPAYGALAHHCVIMGDYEAAESFATDGLKRFPENVPCMEARAKARLLMLDLPAAEQDAASALALDSDSVDAGLCRAAVMLAQGERDEAIKLLETMREREPEDVEVLLVLGNACQMQRQFKRAETCYAAAIEKEPMNWRVFQSLATLELMRGNPANSLVCIDMALELQDAPVLHCLRGTALSRLRRHDEAKSEFKLAVKANRFDAASWIGLAELEGKKRSERAKAVADAERALELDPEGSVGERARRLLQQLRLAE